MPTKWNKKLQAELDGLFDEGLCNNTTPVGDALELSDAFKEVTKDTFKRYFYKKRREFVHEESARNGNNNISKIPDSKYIFIVIHGSPII